MRDDNMTKFLCMYDEFGKGMGLPKMSEFFLDMPYKGKEAVVNYLKNGRKTYAAPGTATDVYTGEVIPIEKCGMTDGEYSWSSSLYHYVEKYNLMLPKEFILKVLQKS